MSQLRDEIVDTVRMLVKQSIKEEYICVWFQVIIEPGYPTISCMYQPKKNPKVMYGPRFSIEQIDVMSSMFKRYRERSAEDGSGNWTELTLVVSPSGEIDFNFYYEPIGPAQFCDRQDAWQAKYTPCLKAKGFRD